ncbi:MAG: hypothetical protein AAB847_02015 [Patescibacteria group bacterium]
METSFRQMIQNRFAQRLRVCLELKSTFGRRSITDQCNFIDNTRHLVAAYKSANQFAAAGRCESAPIILDEVFVNPYSDSPPNTFVFVDCCTSDNGLYDLRGLQNLSVKVTPDRDQKLFDRLMNEQEHNELPLFLYVAYQSAVRGQGLVMSVKHPDKILQVRQFIGLETFIYLSGFGMDVPAELNYLKPISEICGKNILVGVSSRTTSQEIISINNLYAS